MIDYENLPYGVRFLQRGNCKQFTCYLTGFKGKKQNKYFNVNKFGEEQAFKLACEHAKFVEEQREKDRIAFVYSDNNDGTTNMKLFYKKHELLYKISTSDVQKVVPFNWCGNNEGYSVTQMPNFTYMHRYLMDAEEGEFVVHLDGDIKNCIRENLKVVLTQKGYTTTHSSINDFMKERKKKRRSKVKNHINSVKITCVICGFDNPDGLHFDHIHRKDKTVNISKIKTSLMKLKKELKFCQVLCANCHAIKTITELISAKIIIGKQKFVNNLKVTAYKECNFCGKIVVKGEEICFDFDHINPDLKTHAISELTHRKGTIQDIVEELKKCRLLCRNCHFIHTKAQIDSGLFETLKKKRFGAKAISLNSPQN